MSNLAIRVEKLSKQYKLGATIQHDRLKDLLAHSLNGLFRRSPSPVSGPPSIACRYLQLQYLRMGQWDYC